MTKDEKILQNWIPEGTIETRFFNYENMIAFAKHYAKLKEVPVPEVWEKWSELLVAFMKYYKNNVPIGTQRSSLEIVKDYLATNGG